MFRWLFFRMVATYFKLTDILHILKTFQLFYSLNIMINKYNDN